MAEKTPRKRKKRVGDVLKRLLKIMDCLSCEPSCYHDIAQKTGFCRSTVHLYLSTLKKYMPTRVKMVKRSAGNGGRMSHYYWLE